MTTVVTVTISSDTFSLCHLDFLTKAVGDSDYDNKYWEDMSVNWIKHKGIIMQP